METSAILKRLFIAWMALFAITPICGQSTQKSDRDLTVAKLENGAALDGRGKQWSVVIGISKYKHAASSAQLCFAHRDRARLWAGRCCWRYAKSNFLDRAEPGNFTSD